MRQNMHLLQILLYASDRPLRIGHINAATVDEIIPNVLIRCQVRLSLHQAAELPVDGPVLSRLRYAVFDHLQNVNVSILIRNIVESATIGHVSSMQYIFYCS